MNASLHQSPSVLYFINIKLFETVTLLFFSTRLFLDFIQYLEYSINNLLRSFSLSIELFQIESNRFSLTDRDDGNFLSEQGWCAMQPLRTFTLNEVQCSRLYPPQHAHGSGFNPYITDKGNVVLFPDKSVMSGVELYTICTQILN